MLPALDASEDFLPLPVTTYACTLRMVAAHLSKQEFRRVGTGATGPRRLDLLPGLENREAA